MHVSLSISLKTFGVYNFVCRPRLTIVETIDAGVINGGFKGFGPPLVQTGEI